MKSIFLLAACFLLSTPAMAGEAALPEVGVVALEAGKVELTTQLNGRAVAYRIAEVRPQVNGIIQERLFEEGSTVGADVPLYQIDPAVYNARLASAQAGLAKAHAARDTAEAKKIRYDDLVAKKAVPQQEYDEVFAAWKQAEADVGVAEAEVNLARIDLDYTRVLSPLAGVIGKSGVTQGALVTANQTAPMAVIQQIDPIYVDVSQSSVGILRMKRAIDKGILRNDGEGRGTVRLILENGEDYPHEGKVLFSEVTVDQSTGSVSVRAQFPNPDWDLLPGMYVKAIISAAEKDAAITVPQPALLRNVDGSAYVYVVGDDGTVEKRAVTVIQALKDSWLINDGLSEGERIVVEGTQRIRFIPGSPAPRVKAVEAGS